MKKESKHLSKISKKKGSLEETISFGMHGDDPKRYKVWYRDKDVIKEASLEDFMGAEDYSPIPITRITKITKDDKIVWSKGQKELIVKNGQGNS